MKVRVTTMSADFKTKELGTVEADEAVKLFNNHTWQAELNHAESVEAGNEDCCAPDMTFTALPAHFIASIRELDKYNVEVCLPRLDKLFGIFRLSKFYNFKSISQSQVSRLIREFCLDEIEHKHVFFANEAKGSALSVRRKQ